MRLKIFYLTVLASIVLAFGYQIVSAFPSVNLLGNFAVVGTTATTTSNTNLTVSSTVTITGFNSAGLIYASNTGQLFRFASGTSAYVLTATGTFPYFNWEVAGGTTGITAAATTTAGINVATSSNTITLSLRNILATISGFLGTKGNLQVGNGSSNFAEVTVGSDGQFLRASSTATNGVGWETFTPTMATSSAGINFSSAGQTHTFSLRSLLATISGLASTTGNLILGNNASGWNALGVGTNGYVLTSSSTATNSSSWEKVDDKNTYFIIENPAVGEDDAIMTFDKASTLLKIYAVNKGSGDTFTWNLCSAASRQQATSTCNRLAFSTYNVTTATGTPTTYASFGTSSILAGDVMRLVGTSASSTQFNITIYYSTP